MEGGAGGKASIIGLGLGATNAEGPEGIRSMEVGGGEPKISKGGDGGPKELAEIEGGETEK